MLVFDDQHLASREQLALALREDHQYEEAARHWQRLLDIEPDYAAAHLNLGQMYLRNLNNPDKARSHLYKVLDLRPDHPQNEEIRAFLQGS